MNRPSRPAAPASGASRSRPLAALCAASLLLTACKGSDGLSALVRTEQEGAGAHCPAGGLVVLSGLDRNGDGSLQDTEVLPAQTQYLCSAGSLAPLVDVQAEPAGSNCAAGGERLSSGLDRNGNGTLDADEVSTTRYLCSARSEAVHYGDVVLYRAADATALDGVEVVVGDLTLLVEDATELTLPSLQVVSGTLRTSDEDLGERSTVQTLRLSALRSVGTLLLRNADSLQQLEAPLLREANTLEVDYVRSLMQLELPALHAVLTLQVSNLELTALRLPTLVRARRLELYALPRLTTLALGALTEVTELDLSHVGAPELSALELPALARAQSVGLHDNAGFTRVALPALESVAYLQVVRNGSLTGLELPRLGAGSEALVVGQNAKLSECALLEQEVTLRAAGFRGTFQRGGNMPGSACTANSSATCLPVSLGDADRRHAACFVPRTFPDARADCVAVLGTGADLVSLRSPAELEAARLLFTERQVPVGAWMGYEQRFGDLTGWRWRWLDPTVAFEPDPATFWSAHQPDNAGGNERCGMLWSRSDASGDDVGRANDATCSTLRPLLCAAPLP